MDNGEIQVNAIAKIYCHAGEAYAERGETKRNLVVHHSIIIHLFLHRLG